MKKLLLAIIMVLIIAILCSCGADSNNNTTNSVSGYEEIQSETTSSSENNQTNNKSSHYEYTHSAIEGCVIVSSDKLTGECVYKTKCPICGKTNSVQTSACIKSGTLNSEATCTNAQCANWGKNFDVKIEVTAQLVDD